jgi:hypothetical protein
MARRRLRQREDRAWPWPWRQRRAAPAPRTGAGRRGTRRHPARRAACRFFDQLSLPLRDERRRHQHQRFAHQAAQPVFFQNQTRFDGFSEAHLVGEQRPALEMPQHLAHGLLLVHVDIDALERWQAPQILKILGQPHLLVTRSTLFDSPADDRRRSVCLLGFVQSGSRR